ncbi:MAG: M23 family metallopeptidase [Acidobacteriota bacterium]
MNSSRSSSNSSGSAARRYEIQIHPSDIQKGVRYLFLTPRQIGVAAAVLAFFVAFLLHGIVRAPSVLGGWLSHRDFQAQRETRELLGERLDALNRRLGDLRGAAEGLEMRMSKIYLAYGLENDSSIGQGGYPEVPRSYDGSVYADRVNAANALEAETRGQLSALGTFLREIRVFEEEHRDQVASTPSISPLRGDTFVLTSPFGSRKNPFTKAPDFHPGIDLSAPVGTPIYAPSDGIVSFAGRYNARRNISWWRYGNLVSLRNGERFVTLYGHLDSVAVKAGQRVQQGDLIGTVGNTGWSTNPHLHYEVRRLDSENNFRPVDPRVYILDHRWRDEEQLLVRARSAPKVDFEPLPRRIR